MCDFEFRNRKVFPGAGCRVWVEYAFLINGQVNSPRWGQVNSEVLRECLAFAPVFSDLTYKREEMVYNGNVH